MQVVREELEPVAEEMEQAGRKVTDPRIAGAIINALSDETSRRILASTTSKGKPVEEISSDGNIPMSTAYRRVRELTETGLMVVERITISETGRRYMIYRSAFRAVKVELLSGELQVQVILNEDVADRFFRMWQSIRFR
jgi:predicted transcriptional regulator